MLNLIFIVEAVCSWLLYNETSFRETNGNCIAHALCSHVFGLHLSPVNCSFITSFIRAIANSCLLGQEPGYGFYKYNQYPITLLNVSHCWLLWHFMVSCITTMIPYVPVYLNWCVPYAMLSQIGIL